MSGITTGLVSGIDYNALVQRAMQYDTLKFQKLYDQTARLEQEEAALTNLTARFLTATYMITNNLGKADMFNRCSVTTSNENLLTASSNSAARPGVFTFTPMRTAMAQQTIASGVSSRDDALGKEGTITISKGWSLDKDLALGEINGGSGFSKGYIRITDGSGTRANIDLRSCLTMNDVLDAINTNGQVDVWAEMDGDKLVLLDMSGGNTSQIKVDEVNGGRTAASLGLLGTGSTNANGESELHGNSIYYLGSSTKLASLNDGNGLAFDSYLDDMIVTTHDGSQIRIDFNHRATTQEQADGVPAMFYEETIGDLLNTINNAEGNDGRFVASISADGKSLVFTDTTTRYLSADAGPDDDDPDTPPTFVLPDGYDDPNEYEIDEDGNVIYAATNTQGKTAGEKVVDPDQPPSRITQGGSAAILRTLGLVARYDSTNPPTAVDGVFTTRALLGGLNSPLVASLNGGYGLSDAKEGNVQVQDRAGNSAALHFDADELRTLNNGTLEDAIDMLNAKLTTAAATDKDGNARTGVEIEIAINDRRTGLQLIDNSGGTSHNLQFRDMTEERFVRDENGDPVLDDENNPVLETFDPNIASLLGLDVDTTDNTAAGTSLNLQVVSSMTKLTDLNGGKGITMGGAKIVIDDTLGASVTITFGADTHKTLGDVIEEINSYTGSGQNKVMVRAQLNSTGDGIELIDLANGTQAFSCSDASSSSTFAKQLNIVGSVKPSDLEEGERPTISGGERHEIQIAKTDTLDDIIKKINDSGGNFSASAIVDGAGAAYRLIIAGGSTGKNGTMNIDLDCLGVTIENLSEAQDALVAYGDPTSNTSVMVASSSNTFKNIVDGIDITIKDTSTAPVTITSERTGGDVKAVLKLFVENYNTFREEWYAATFYDKVMEQGAILYNNSVARAMERDVSDVLLKRVFGIQGVNSLTSLGVTMAANLDSKGQVIETNAQTGKLAFDETAFDAAWAENPEAVMEFFYEPLEIDDPKGTLDDDGNIKQIEINQGWTQSFVNVVESLTGIEGGKTTSALQTLDAKITKNYDELLAMQARLQAKEAALMKQYQKMELSMAKMQADMTSVQSIAQNWMQNLGQTYMNNYGYY